MSFIRLFESQCEALSCRLSTDVFDLLLVNLIGLLNHFV